MGKPYLKSSPMSTTSDEKKFNIFLLLMTVSLVGNACADFGFIWHAVANLPSADKETGIRLSQAGLLPSFYLGQAFGFIFLAPVLSAYADRYSKRAVSITIDVTYALFLVGILTVNIFGALRPEILFAFSLFTATLSGLHRNVVGFGALKALSDKVDVTRLVSKFNAIYFIVGLIGSAIAGTLYNWNGLNSCLSIGILSFLPMPFVYFQIFPDYEKLPDPVHRNFIREIKDGIHFIYNDRVLITNSICVMLWNISANMFPGIVGIAFQRFMPGKTDLASYAVSASILLGILSYFPAQRVANQLAMHWVIPYCFVLPTITMTLCIFHPNPWLFTLGYALNCGGSALLNILSSGVRVKRVPNELLGRVNTAHTAIISFGQIIGSVWLLPVLAESLGIGAAVIASSLLISGVIAFVFMPKISLGEVLS
jgi:MFS family permease